MSKKKRKAERGRVASNPDLEYRPSITYRAIPVGPGEKTGCFISGGGITIEVSQNPSSWEQTTDEMVRFTELVIQKLIADTINSLGRETS